MGLMDNTRQANCNHCTKQNKNKVPALKLGIGNVRTMTPGLSDNLQQVSDVRKTAVINNELCRLQVDIIALQETRLPESGIIRERDYSCFWQGKEADVTVSALQSKQSAGLYHSSI